MQRVDPFKAEQFKKEAIEHAKKLASYISKWNAYSGTENARHLNAHLARFLKANRQP